MPRTTITEDSRIAAVDALKGTAAAEALLSEARSRYFSDRVWTETNISLIRQRAADDLTEVIKRLTVIRDRVHPLSVLVEQQPDADNV